MLKFRATDQSVTHNVLMRLQPLTKSPDFVTDQRREMTSSTLWLRQQFNIPGLKLITGTPTSNFRTINTDSWSECGHLSNLDTDMEVMQALSSKLSE